MASKRDRKVQSLPDNPITLMNIPQGPRGLVGLEDLRPAPTPRLPVSELQQMESEQIRGGVAPSRVPGQTPYRDIGVESAGRDVIYNALREGVDAYKNFVPAAVGSAGQFVSNAQYVAENSPTVSSARRAAEYISGEQVQSLPDIGEPIRRWAAENTPEQTGLTGYGAAIGRGVGGSARYAGGALPQLAVDVTAPIQRWWNTPEDSPEAEGAGREAASAAVNAASILAAGPLGRSIIGRMMPGSSRFARAAASVPVEGVVGGGITTGIESALNPEMSPEQRNMMFVESTAGQAGIAGLQAAGGAFRNQRFDFAWDRLNSRDRRSLTRQFGSPEAAAAAFNADPTVHPVLQKAEQIVTQAELAGLRESQVAGLGRPERARAALRGMEAPVDGVIEPPIQSSEAGSVRIPGSGRQVEHNLSRKLREDMGVNVDPMTHDVRSTALLRQQADDLIARDPAQARQLVMGEGAEVNDLEMALSRALINKAVADGNIQEAVAITRKQKDIDLAAGRTVQAAGAYEPTEAASILRLAQDLLKRNPRDRRELSVKDAQELLDLHKNWLEAIDPTEKQKAAYAMIARMRMLPEGTLMDTVSSFIKAGLLTAPTTHEVNILSTAGYQGLSALESYPAAVIDMGLSLFTGQRTVMPKGITGEARATARAATNGLREAWEVIRNGFTQEQAESVLRYGKKSPEFKQVFSEKRSGSNVLDSYIHGVFRLLGAEDRIFKAYAIESSLQEHAKLQARNEGLSGDAARIRANMLYRLARAGQNEELMAKAIADGEFNTFNNETILHSGVTAMRGTIRRKGEAGEIIDFAIDRVAPFVRTPSSLGERVLEGLVGAPWAVARSGTRIAKALTSAQRSEWRKAVSEAFDANEQRLFSQMVARNLTGAALVYAGMVLNQNGLMTGNIRGKEGEENVNAEIQQPNGALKIGGRWHRIARFTPIGNLLTIGASMNENGAERVPEIFGRTVLDQPYMQAPRELITSLESPERRGPALAASLAGQVIPTIVNRAGAAMDPYQREATTFTERLQSRIPVLRESLPVRTSPLGQRMVNEPLVSMLDPTSSVEQRTDVVSEELAKLKTAGVDVSLPGLNKRPDETNEQFRQRKASLGRMTRTALPMLFATREYQNMTPQEQSDAIGDIITKLRRRVAERRR